jgi:hypothetical protein
VWALVGELFVERVGLVTIEITDDTLVSLAILLTGLLRRLEGDLGVLLD